MPGTVIETLGLLGDYFFLVSCLSFISAPPFPLLHCLIISRLNSLSLPALIMFGFRDMIYASPKGEVFFSELLFLLQFHHGQSSLHRD